MPSPNESCWYIIRVLIRALVLGCWNLVLNSLLLWWCYIIAKTVTILGYLYHSCLIIYIYIIIYLKHVQRLPVLDLDLSDSLGGKEGSIVDETSVTTLLPKLVCV